MRKLLWLVVVAGVIMLCVPAQSTRVILKDGRVIDGEILEKSSNTIFIKDQLGIKMEIPSEAVERIEHQTKTSAAVKATMPELVIQNGHLDYVHSVTYSPDGKTIASASGDNTVKLWDASTGELRYTLEGHSGPIQSIVYSPDGKSIAWYSESFPEAISDEISVKVWNPTTGKLLQSLRGHVESISSIAYSPDGKSIASGSIDKTVKLWRLATGERELFRKTLERCYW